MLPCNCIDDRIGLSRKKKRTSSQLRAVSTSSIILIVIVTIIFVLLFLFDGSFHHDQQGDVAVRDGSRIRGDKSNGNADITLGDTSEKASDQAQQQNKATSISATPFDMTSGNVDIDKAYKLAFDEMNQNIVNGTFIAGSGWTQLWTRDTSYAIELAAGLVHPKVSLDSLLKCTQPTEIPQRIDLMTSANMNQQQKQDLHKHHQVYDDVTVWYQDACGHFDGWPYLTDAIVGARGAWSLYLSTGNTTFLSWAYQVTVDSLRRAEQHQVIQWNYLKNDGNDDDVELLHLAKGCSSFMESNSGYPSKYKNSGRLVGQTKALSTNILYYNGYYLAAEMGRLLGNEAHLIQVLQQKAEALQQAIRQQLWLSKQGYYSYLQDEENVTLTQMEGLGEALVLLTPGFETSGHRIRSILDNTYRTENGLPCLWPRFDNLHKNTTDIAQYYHNGRIWPFVQGYWAIAAARHRRSDVFAQELLSLLHLSQQKMTFAEFYELDATFPPERRRQLWSGTGFLGMVYQGVFGIELRVGGMYFAPNKAKELKLDATISLYNVQYRLALLDIRIKGYGSEISSFRIDGVSHQDPIFPASSQAGRYLIEIEL